MDIWSGEVGIEPPSSVWNNGYATLALPPPFFISPP
jgi:hypothetical protein